MILVNGGGNVGIDLIPALKFDVSGPAQFRSGYGSLPSDIGLAIGGKGTSPNAGSIAWGDGTGWRLNLGYSASGTFTTRFGFLDSGKLYFTSGISKLCCDSQKNRKRSSQILCTTCPFQ